MDQFYRSTMAIYKSIMEQFNPALENLVYLGNNYLRAFHARPPAALINSTARPCQPARISQGSLQESGTSGGGAGPGPLVPHPAALSEAAEVYFSAIQKIGEQALQSSTSQILGEILVQMSDTQRHLNSDLKVVVQTFHGDLLQHMEKNTKLDMQFIKDSRQHYEIEYRHRAANLEKCMSELWRMERKRDKDARAMKESVNRLHAQMQAFVAESQRAAELEEKRRYRFLAEKHLLLSKTFLQFFGRIRRGDPPRSRSNSFGERPGGARRVRALVSHSEGANHTLLRFSAGDVVEVLVPEAQNGWLYGKLEGSSTGGWFPEAYVKPLEEVSVNPMNPLNPMNSLNELPSRSSPLRGSHSLNDLLDRPGSSISSSEYWDGQSHSRTPSRVPSRAPSPAPTPLPGSRRSSMGSTGGASDIKRLMSWEQHPPELFPRGTNPFATVKLRPTVTNDRSAPLIR
ncbi:brain-specific angiogenesis inhibitor 1-associated protein 2-like protein 2 [Tupaia chinensis]|uniref:brain-specific angiogenesis inhibitor 1-associated protein 2-like protein 2 n=1 Tax=Tupaia chinensis TaxID=246437 RepID=UPI000FFB8B29|nr:brain-specific angiogenesis inhibitor 1-associated protein 2-like protein 2 [Tupaia chinensis]